MINTNWITIYTILNVIILVEDLWKSSGIFRNVVKYFDSVGSLIKGSVYNCMFTRIYDLKPTIISIYY